MRRRLVSPHVGLAAVVLGPVLGLGACTENTFFTQQHTDVFQQNRRNTVDVLMVVDNSCSMAEEQDKLASNFRSFIEYFENVNVDYQIAVITTDTRSEEFSGRMLGGDDEIVFSGADGVTLDRVAWDRTWPVARGVALALDPAVVSPTYNDVADSWCPATSPYGAGDLGTPGEANPACSGASGAPPPDQDSGASGAPPPDGDTGAEPQPPALGDVLVTEFLADAAAVDDSVGEWVELTNLSDETVDLGGTTLSDLGRNLYTLPEGTLLEAGQALVLARSADDALNGGLSGALALGEDFTLNNNVLVLSPAVEDVQETFSEMVALGIGGSGIEMGLHAAYQALSEPLLSTVNAGFLREEANLSLIIVSDEEDSSQFGVDEYLRWFTELKGEEAFRDHSRFNLSAVVGDREPEFAGEPSCSSDDGVASYGSRYIDLAERTDGLVDSICDEDFSPIAQELGLTLSGLVAEFALSENPNENTLVVSLYETADDASFVKELTRDVDYSYVVDGNLIRFVEDQVPPELWYIKVEYELLAEGTTREDSGDASE